MLVFSTRPVEEYDYISNTFVNYDSVILNMEHSLISLSKWEAKWKLPFLYLLEKQELDREQLSDYYRCMLIKPLKDDSVMSHLSQEDEIKIVQYINDPMTAAKISQKEVDKATKKAKRNQGDKMYSDLIYYWMFELGIPKDCEKWHLNRLLNLIYIFGDKQAPASSKRMSKKETAMWQALENEKRKARYKTRG